MPPFIIKILVRAIFYPLLKNNSLPFGFNRKMFLDRAGRLQRGVLSLTTARNK